MPGKRVAYLLIFFLHNAGAEVGFSDLNFPQDEQLPDMEFLDFLGQWQDTDGESLDPREFEAPIRINISDESENRREFNE